MPRTPREALDLIPNWYMLVGMVPGSRKSDHVASLLTSRIHVGAYVHRGLPAERELAEELGVSRTTTRQAIEKLESQGLVQRQPNGRLTVTPAEAGGPCHVAFLVPSITSTSVEFWRLAIQRAAVESGAAVRVVMYENWQDPVLSLTLRDFGRAFLYTAAHPLPDTLTHEITQGQARVAVVDRDLSALGLPSITAISPHDIHRLLDTLETLGHRHIDCFNIQPVDPVIAQRIEQWNLWRAAHGFKGQLHGNPNRPIDLPIERAILEFGDLLDRGDLAATALVCPTAPAALGAVRALADRGLSAGPDLSVCTVNDESIARFVVPSITSLVVQDPIAPVRLCMEWLLDTARDWAGPLLIRPTDTPLFQGESTQAPRPAELRTLSARAST